VKFHLRPDETPQFTTTVDALLVCLRTPRRCTPREAGAYARAKIWRIKIARAAELRAAGDEAGAVALEAGAEALRHAPPGPSTADTP
jgi:hypothetical protein